MLVFISHATGLREPKTVLLAAVATMVVYKGAGLFVICPMPCCKGGACGDGSCSTPSCNKDEEVIEV